MLGYIQQQIVIIGREKGFVTSEDVRKFFKFKIDVEMNKLVVLGYFKNPVDCGAFIKWDYVGGKNDPL